MTVAHDALDRRCTARPAAQLQAENAMLIGLIADTHIPEAGPDLWPQVYQRFREERVAAILHAGDIHMLAVLDRLEQRVGVPVIACRGNGDDGSGGRPLCPEDPRLRPAWALDWQGYRIGLVHDLEEFPPHRTVGTMMQQYFGGPCEVVVCGDTHVAAVDLADETIVVNPGSPMYPRNMNTSLGTIGFLHLGPDAAEAWIEPLHPETGPLLHDGPVLDHRTAAARHPDQWLLLAVHRHDRATGLSIGAVVAAGFAADEAPSLRRALYRRDPSAVLLFFHSASPPERGIAQARPLPTPSP
jgi:putative phosphoesterase